MKPCKVHSVNELVAIIKTRFCTTGWSLLAIDGDTGAGKTTLATELGSIFDADIVNLDKYLIEKKGHFVEALNFIKLICDLNSSISSHKRVILEGCCMEHIIQRTNLKIDFKVYVAIVGAGDEYVANDLLDDEISEEDALKNEAEICAASGYDTGPSLHKELIEYHKRAFPLHKADAVLLRRDCA